MINRKFLRKMTAVADMPDPIPYSSDTPTVTQTTKNAPAVPVQEVEGHVEHTSTELKTPFQPIADTPVDVGPEPVQAETGRRYPVRDRQTNVRIDKQM